MKYPTFTTVALALLLQESVANPLPQDSSISMRSLQRRDGGTMISSELQDTQNRRNNRAGAIGNIAGMVKILVDIYGSDGNIYEAKEGGVMCSVRFIYGYPDGGCNLYITCPPGGDDARRQWGMGQWTGCSKEGYNVFEDDRIGKIGIEWGPEEKDGLLNQPIMYAEYVDEAAPWEVEGIAKEQPRVCRMEQHVDEYNEPIQNEYECGVPLIGRGASGGDDTPVTEGGGSVDSNGPENAEGWRPGWCTMHVTQHQKLAPSDPNSVYSFDLTVFDDNGKELGKTGDRLFIPTNERKGIDTALPNNVDIQAPAIDDDAIWFHYGDMSFTSNDQAHMCNFGKFDNGKRKGDCGFTCDGPAPEE